MNSNGAVPLDVFFPFGFSNGDDALPRDDDRSSVKVRIPSAFPFMKNNESEIYVNINGAISFASEISVYTPRCGPLDTENRMIAVYWADVDTTKWDQSNVFYRVTGEINLLEKANREIIVAFPKLLYIAIKWLFIATWEKVTYYGADRCRKPYPSNTFQATLATDGIHSFVILYYNQLVWTAGIASNGGNCTGLGGRAAKVGFDAGDGRNFYAVDGSCTQGILNMSNLSSGPNITSGKWIFRVDESQFKEHGQIRLITHGYLSNCIIVFN